MRNPTSTGAERDDLAEVLAAETERLRMFAAAWTPARWAAQAAFEVTPPTDLPAGLAALPPQASRADVLRALVQALAEVGRRAGTGAPLGAVPGEVATAALVDQLAVVVADLLAARPPRAVAAAALAYLLWARALLDGHRPPADLLGRVS